MNSKKQFIQHVEGKYHISKSIIYEPKIFNSLEDILDDSMFNNIGELNYGKSELRYIKYIKKLKSEFFND